MSAPLVDGTHSSETTHALAPVAPAPAPVRRDEYVVGTDVYTVNMLALTYGLQNTVSDLQTVILDKCQRDPDLEKGSTIWSVLTCGQCREDSSVTETTIASNRDNVEILHRVANQPWNSLYVFWFAVVFFCGSIVIVATNHEALPALIIGPLFFGMWKLGRMGSLSCCGRGYKPREKHTMIVRSKRSVAVASGEIRCRRGEFHWGPSYTVLCEILAADVNQFVDMKRALAIINSNAATVRAHWDVCHHDVGLYYAQARPLPTDP